MKERGPSPDFVPDKRARWASGRRKQEEPSLTRRSLLFGVGAFAAVRVLPQDLIDDLAGSFEKESSEKQKALDAAIAAIQKRLREPEVLEALEGKGKHPIMTVLRAIEAPLLQEHLEDTSYDTTELHKKYVHSMRFPYGRGNGTYWRDGRTVLTAAHATYGTERGVITYPVKNIDIDMVDVSGTAETSDSAGIVEDDISMTNNDIHAQFVAVVGVDVDDTASTAAHDRGHKTYPGVAIKISPGLARRLTNNAEEVIQMENSFMLILPPGESEADLNDLGKLALKPEDESPLHAKGMSGSTVYAYLNGKYVPAGVFWGAGPMPDQEFQRTLSVGYFHGIDEVRRVEERKKQPVSDELAALD
ncbi:hypothetical protein C4556_00165 [Candidatus Parcubacteria bacterium]|nr:MAG: hypothetical protein C4556_00165 [Candidatus Parcubacteria bacterium]